MKENCAAFQSSWWAISRRRGENRTGARRPTALVHNQWPPVAAKATKGTHASERASAEHADRRTLNSINGGPQKSRHCLCQADLHYSVASRLSPLASPALLLAAKLAKDLPEMNELSREALAREEETIEFASLLWRADSWPACERVGTLSRARKRGKSGSSCKGNFSRFRWQKSNALS